MIRGLTGLSCMAGGCLVLYLQVCLETISWWQSGVAVIVVIFGFWLLGTEKIQ